MAGDRHIDDGAGSCRYTVPGAVARFGINGQKRESAVSISRIYFGAVPQLVSSKASSKYLTAIASEFFCRQFDA